MRIVRVSDPESLSLTTLSRQLADETNTVVLQFSKPSAYSASLLKAVNDICERFKNRVNVRFWDHYGSQFDCRTLRQLSSVRSLNLDCLAEITHVDELTSLSNLEEFTFGAFEMDLPKLLENPALKRLRKLILADTRKRSIDLAPLVDYEKLEELFISHHSRHIEALVNLQSLTSLSLSGTPKKQSLSFVSKMTGLRSLALWLGSREGLEDIAHVDLTSLGIFRVRGFRNLEMSAFPALRRLRIEDQPQLRVLPIGSAANSLRHLTIWNCKNLAELNGLEKLTRLERLFLGVTAMHPDDTLRRTPESLRQLSLLGYGTRRDGELKQRIATLGYDHAAQYG